MPTYEQQTLPFGEDASTFSRADSLASRSASRENERARQTIVTSGLKCCEQFERFGQRTREQESLPERQRTADVSDDGAQRCAPHGWRNWPTQSPVRSGNDGLSELLDGITVPAWCRESIKAYGNAVVPQLVKVIFKVIEEYETGCSI